jgi:hypothetical protein
MDYNMNGLVSSMGWNNPEVTYEEVDCASNGYTDWNCQCASASSSSSSGATASPTAAPTALAATSAPTAKAATAAPTAKVGTSAPTAKTPVKAATSAPVATNAPAPVAGSIKIQVNSGANQYWFGFSVVSNVANIVSVDVMPSGATSWTRMNFEGNQYWNMFSFAPTSPIVAPISLRFNGANGSVIANNIVTSFQASTVDTGVSV